MVVKDEKANIGKNIIVTNSGAFTIAEATIAVAHRREVMILIFLICVITAALLTNLKSHSIMACVTPNHSIHPPQELGFE